MGRKEKFFRAYYIQNTHWDTHQNYIYNIHLEITFRNYISTYIRLTPFVHLPTARSSAHSSTALHKIPPILFIFRTYIRITLELLSAPPLARIYAHYNYISNLHSNIHQNYIRLAYPLIHLPTTSFTLRPPIDVLSHYNYIQKLHFNLH